MREIVFDTETTGLSPANGDRMVEIGCVEMVNRVETGKTFHSYFYPQRAMDPGAQAVHGLSDTFLSDKPLFEDVVEDLLDFLDTSPLVAHNAKFDFSFLNYELGNCGRLKISESRMVDTLSLARIRHPGAKHSLDALCSRFGIDRSHRIKHGALLDAELLAQVYVELTGGRQIGFALPPEAKGNGFIGDADMAERAKISAPAIHRAARAHSATPEERERHLIFIATLKDPLWFDGPLGDDHRARLATLAEAASPA